MGWLREHRVLVVVLGAGLLLAIFESRLPDVEPGRPDEPSVYLTPETNIADVSAEVYPARALSYYYRAQQAAFCAAEAAPASAVCRERGPVAPGEIRELLAKSIATGNRSIELALYNYALVLLQENAPQAAWETAIRSWRDSYPDSNRPDPRVAYRELTQGR